MKTIDDSGSAFPNTATDQGHANNVPQGMTLRQYYAGKAMQSLLSAEWLGLTFRTGDGPPRWNGYVLNKYGERRVEATKVLSEMAFAAADAMVVSAAQRT